MWASNMWPAGMWTDNFWPIYGTGEPVVTDARAVHGQAARWILFALVAR